MVNRALQSSSVQNDPLKDIIPPSDVEYALDNFYNVESIGIKNEVSSSYDDK